MHTKTIISAATLAIALGFSSASFAQAVTLGTATVTEAEMPQVQARCDDLSMQATAADPGSENNNEDAAAADATAAPAAGDAAAATTTEDNAEESTEEGTAGLIELDTITLEQCIEAGLVAK